MQVIILIGTANIDNSPTLIVSKPYDFGYLGVFNGIESISTIRK